MKRLILSATMVWLFFGMAATWAGTACDPTVMPDQGQFGIRLRGTWTLKQEFDSRDVDVSRDETHYSVAVKDMEIDNDQSFIANIACGVNDRLSVCAGLGVRDGGQFKFSNWDEDSGTWWHNKFNFNTVFAWSLGATARLFESPEGLGALLNAGYQRYDNRTNGDMESRGHGTSINNFRADYWQADITTTLYRKLGPLTVYGGLGYEYAELSLAGNANQGTIYENHLDFGDIKNNDNLNTFIGLCWKLTDRVGLNLRGDFVSREAVTLGISGVF